MIIRIGYIPYLNMVPFHQGFGPHPVESEGVRFEFTTLSPHALGRQAEKGLIDAGALSLVDALRLSPTYEPLGTFGIGLKRPALSVLLFSQKPMAELEGSCAVTDETATSSRLLQVLLELRYNRKGMSYERVNSQAAFDGKASALLLIGDEALKAKKAGVSGYPIITDLGREWYDWQGVPFVFARWCVRKSLGKEIKSLISRTIQNSLYSNRSGTIEDLAYWNGFVYKLNPEHEKSIARFAALMEKACLTV